MSETAAEPAPEPDVANPAARVAGFLRSLDGRNGEGSAGDQLAAVWYKAWPRDASLIFSRVDALGADFEEVVLRLRKRAEDGDRMARHYLDRVVGVEEPFADFFANSGGPLRLLTDRFSAQARFAIESTAVLFGDEQPTIDTTTVFTLIENIAELLQQIDYADDLDGGTKTWLHSRLMDIQVALDNYAVLGYEGFERATSEFVGGLQTKPGLIERIGRSATANGISIILSLLMNTVMTAAAVKELTAGPAQPVPQVVLVLQHEIDAAKAERGESPATRASETSVDDGASPDPDPDSGLDIQR